MSTQPSIITRPQPGIMYGLNHAYDGTPIVRVQKLVKVGIGQPKGPAIMVWIENEKWRGSLGYKSKSTNVTTFNLDDRARAEAWYRAKKKEAPTCNFPRKLPFFSFTRQVGDGSFEPDFDAIEKHGSTPTELDILFLNNDPLEAAYQMWSKSELRCTGDGLHAERSFNLARTDDEKKLVEESKLQGARFFPVLDGCWTNGCKYVGQKDGCKPHADLRFQLFNSLRVGGTAYFTTTGMRSIRQMFSAIHEFKAMTGGGDANAGRIAGVPFTLTVRPYQTNHDNQPATQYGVSLEFRAKNIDELRKGLVEQAANFHRNMRIIEPVVRSLGPQQIVPLLEAGSDDDDGVIYEDEAGQARAMTDEFSEGDGTDDEGEPVAATEPEPEPTGDLKSKLRSRRPTEPTPIAEPVTAEPLAKEKLF